MSFLLLNIQIAEMLSISVISIISIIFFSREMTGNAVFSFAPVIGPECFISQ